MSKKLIINVIFSILISAGCVAAQTSGFVYQGKLNDGASAASGTYQFEFRLYDAAANGNQIGQPISNLPATVTNGIFAVNLDFGASAFDGAARYLEIGVRLNGSQQPYTVLNPRQQITSTPYAVKSLKANEAVTATTANNSTNLGGFPAAQYVQTGDNRLSDDRNPTPGSANYIQNTQNQQATSNFNISGEGKANTFTAATGFNIGANRVLHAPGTDNIFVGRLAGSSIAAGGNYNAFFGAESGKSNTSGLNNTFAGAYSGRANTNGSNNAFFGANAGSSNNASANSFFGSNSGFSNSSGADNSFFGNSAGLNNSIGNFNSFFGRSAGATVTNAGSNAMFGAYAGENTTTGGNAYFGAFAGRNNSVGFSNVFVGLNAGKENTGGSSNTFVGANTDFYTANANGGNNTLLGAGAKLTAGFSYSTVIGAGAQSYLNNSISLGRVGGEDTVKVWGDMDVDQKLTVGGNASVLGQITTTLTGGTTSASVCGKSSGVLYTLISCSSSRRYKDNIQTFTPGLSLVRNLRPVTFNWKDSGTLDIGFVAEEVAEVEPLLATYNGSGQIEGVKYAQITTALVNAVREQQGQIEKQNEQIRQQSAQIEALKALLCQSNSTAAVCRYRARKIKQFSDGFGK